METLYTAHGLQLTSSFDLPGMRPASVIDGFPALSLVLVDPATLERRWSGTSEPPEWRGRQGDGRDLTIERGSTGDLLFTYGDLARFRLDANMQRLDCAPSIAGLDWQRILIGKVVPSISVMMGYEGLHAAAVDSPGGVVAIMAPSGSGKSTLALDLLRRGWPLFADDALMLSDVGGTVSAHPGTPHMNLAQRVPTAIDPESLGSTLGILTDERWLAVKSVAGETRPVRLLCLLERGPNLELGLQALPANPLLLAPYMLGISRDPERRRARFDLYSDLMESATLVHLTAGPRHRPEQLADLIEGATAREREPVGGAYP